MLRPQQRSGGQIDGQHAGSVRILYFLHRRLVLRESGDAAEAVLIVQRSVRQRLSGGRNHDCRRHFRTVSYRVENVEIPFFFGRSDPHDHIGIGLIDPCPAVVFLRDLLGKLRPAGPGLIRGLRFGGSLRRGLGLGHVRSALRGASCQREGHNGGQDAAKQLFHNNSTPFVSFCVILSMPFSDVPKAGRIHFTPFPGAGI